MSAAPRTLNPKPAAQPCAVVRGDDGAALVRCPARGANLRPEEISAEVLKAMLLLAQQAPVSLAPFPPFPRPPPLLEALPPLFPSPPRRNLRAPPRRPQAMGGEAVDKAVVTVPAYFSSAQSAATLSAARMAGLSAVRSLREPIAAAMAYGVGASPHDENVLVRGGFPAPPFPRLCRRISPGASKPFRPSGAANTQSARRRRWWTWAAAPSTCPFSR